MTRSKKYYPIILNAMRTPDGTVLNSIHRHDYITHEDENGKVYMLDGGRDYVRCSAHGDEVLMTLYADEPHSVQRWVLTWGTYGKNGDQPLQRKPIALMDTDHLNKVLEDCNPRDVIRVAMQEELIYRKLQ